MIANIEAFVSRDETVQCVEWEFQILGLSLAKDQAGI